MPFSGAHNEDVPDRHIQMVLTHHPDAGPRVESLLKDFNEVRSSWSWLELAGAGCITHGAGFLPCLIG